MQAREIPSNKTLREGGREKIIIQSASGRYSLCVLIKALRGKKALCGAFPYKAIFALIPSPPRSPSPYPLMQAIQCAVSYFYSPSVHHLD